MPTKRKITKALNEIVHEQTKPRQVIPASEFNPKQKLEAMMQTPKGKQMIEDSPIYSIKDGKETLVKPRMGSRRRVSFMIGHQAWKDNIKKENNDATAKT